MSSNTIPKIYNCMRHIFYISNRRYSQKTIEQLKMELNLKTRPNPIVAKLETPQFKSIFNEGLNTLIDLFKKNNFELRVAGGAVRDLLLEKVPTDVDFATTATPMQMKEMFTAENIRMINLNGEKHGTVTPRLYDSQFEITTLRIDVVTNGRHAEVEFTTDWLLDANRRDLTINSMFLDFDGNVYDYFYGYDDLLQRKISFVGNAESRIKEDYLRILRYFRFYGKISSQSDNHEIETLEAIKRNIQGLKMISGERIWTELKKIFEGNFAQHLIVKFLECGAAPFIGLPEDVNVKEFQRVSDTCEQFKAHRLHSITLLSSLLRSEQQACDLHQRLKFSAYERDLAKFLTLNMEATKSIDEIQFYQAQCYATISSYKLQKEYVLELLKYNGKKDLFLKLLEWEIPKCPINGDLLRSHDCPKGAVMGAVMRELKDIWIKSDFKLSDDELLKRLPEVIQMVEAQPHKSPKKAKLK